MNMQRRVKGTDLAILTLIVVACAIPFLNQPFHMDDNFYLDLARNAQVNPWFPSDMPYVFQGINMADLGSHSHPLFQTYFLAAIMRFFGEGPGKEWIYHSFALVFPLLAVVSFYFLCARYLDRPLWPSALFACSPLLLVMQHTLMTDVPMLAFWLASVSCFLYATDHRKTTLYAASGLFMTAAMFTSYQSFALVPLLGFYCLRKNGGRRGWTTLLLAPSLVVFWFLLNCIHYERFLFGLTLDYIGTRQPVSLHTLAVKLFSIFAYQGWLFVFPFFVFCLLARQLRWRALPLVLLGAAVLAQLVVPDYRFIDKCIFLTGFAASFFILLEMASNAWTAIVRGRSALDFGTIEEQFLGLWYFGFLLFCLFAFTEGSARYILPMLPPVLLCYCRRLEISEITEYRLPSRFLNSAMLASGSLVFSLVWALALSHADQEFARIYPRAARDIARSTGDLESYGVGEWGFRYYLRHAGIQSLPADESLIQGGSFIAIPKLATPYDIASGLRSMMMPIETFRYDVKTPLRVLDWKTPAGFYSTGWGVLPFSYSRETLEEIEVFQVNFMVERLPHARIEAISGIHPWPGYASIGDKAPLAVLAKPGTRLVYPFSVRAPTRLQLLCGVSSDSFQIGDSESFTFSVRQSDPDGKVLSESNLNLQPGIREEDRRWHPILLNLREIQNGVLEFRYFQTGNDSAGVGAFSQSVLQAIR